MAGKESGVKLKRNYRFTININLFPPSYSHLGIIPLKPMSTTVSPAVG
jgi:hypothetical protein